MACGTDKLSTPLGCDALSRAITGRMSGVDLVDATKLGRPRQTTTPGGGSLPPYQG